MGSIKVTVFGRVKPCPKKLQNPEFYITYGDQEDYVTFGSSRSPGRKSYRFQKIFGPDSTQEQIFEIVAKPVINKVLAGYNGTIFTYGQTGSGKTYTMTGDIENWICPGLIPRTLQEIFKAKAWNTGVSITYCEIYNEHIYDLIGFDNLESRVNVMEDSVGITHFRNLSVHTVATAYEALQLLIRGDANKMMSETVSNARSSRSHVIFSIALEIPSPKEEKLCWKPVLYLVDLAGSEKLSRGKSSSGNPWETRYINLSLHYLEQVLVALRQPGRVHIPYRNSLVTALLRNSLGGNCLTSMIATFSLAMGDIEETHQTCRFAERIALIRNEVKLTETSDPQKEINFLRRENEKLRAQLKLIGREQELEELNEDEKAACLALVRKYIQSTNVLDLPLSDVRKMEYCFSLMREFLKRNELMVQEKTKEGKEVTRDFQLYVPQRRDASSSMAGLIPPNMERNLSKSAEKTWRGKRYPLDLPKVNITYKRWKSTERIPVLEVGHLDCKDVSLRDTTSTENESDVTKSESSKPLENNEVKTRKSVKDTKYDNGDGYRQVKNRPSEGPQVDGVRTEQPDESEETAVPSDKPEIVLKETLPSEENVTRLSDSDSKDGGDSDDNFVVLLANNNMTLRDCGPFSSLKALKKFQIEMEKEREVHFWEQESVVSATSSDFSVGRMPLTGDAEVDEEILRFYKTRYDFFKGKD